MTVLFFSYPDGDLFQLTNFQIYFKDIQRVSLKYLCILIFPFKLKFNILVDHFE